MRKFIVLLVAVSVGACSSSPAAPLAEPALGVWIAADAGPLSTLALDIQPDPNVAGLSGPVYATRRDCRPGDRFPCLLTGFIMSGAQDGAGVLLKFTFPAAPLGATFTGEQLADGRLRGTLEVFDGTSLTGRRYDVTFHR